MQPNEHARRRAARKSHTLPTEWPSSSSESWMKKKRKGHPSSCCSPGSAAASQSAPGSPAVEEAVPSSSSIAIIGALREVLEGLPRPVLSTLAHSRPSRSRFVPRMSRPSRSFSLFHQDNTRECYDPPRIHRNCKMRRLGLVVGPRCSIWLCIWLTAMLGSAMGMGGSASPPLGAIPTAFAGHLLLRAGLDRRSTACWRNSRMGLAPRGRRCGRLDGLYMTAVDGPSPNSDDDRELFGHLRAGRAEPAQSFQEAPSEVISTHSAARAALLQCPFLSESLYTAHG